MTITTPTTGMTLVQAATMLAAHLADHTLPEPAALRVSTRGLHSEVMAQLCATSLPTVAKDLLAWADTLTTITAEAWRVPTGEYIHLSLTSTLTGPASTAELDIFGAVAYASAHFPDLQAGNRRTVPLGQLRSWATLDGPGDRR